MGLILGVLTRVPAWVWLLLAALAWGAWQRHEAGAAASRLDAERLQASQQREAALAAAVHEQARIATAQGAIADDTRQRLDRARAAARRAGDAARRLRESAAGAAATASAAAAAGDCTAAATAAGMQANVLGRAVERAAVLAEYADAAAAAGSACERSYDAVRAAP